MSLNFRTIFYLLNIDVLVFVIYTFLFDFAFLIFKYIKFYAIH